MRSEEVVLGEDVEAEKDEDEDEEDVDVELSVSTGLGRLGIANFRFAGGTLESVADEVDDEEEFSEVFGFSFAEVEVERDAEETVDVKVLLISD